MKNGIGRPTKAQAAEHDLWARKSAAVRVLNTEAYDLAVAICEFIGGGAEHEYGPGRNQIFHMVNRMPKFNGAAQDRIRRNTI
jgi:hypothetical protein